jgi:hypothetical protein
VQRLRRRIQQQARHMKHPLLVYMHSNPRLRHCFTCSANALCFLFPLASVRRTAFTAWLTLPRAFCPASPGRTPSSSASPSWICPSNRLTRPSSPASRASLASLPSPAAPPAPDHPPLATHYRLSSAFIFPGQYAPPAASAPHRAGNRGPSRPNHEKPAQPG